MQAGPGNTVQLNPVITNGQFSKWQMSLNNGPLKGPTDYPSISIPKGTANSAIAFNIGGSPNNNITFAPKVAPPPPPGSGPMYIQPGTTKPTSGVYGDFSYTVSTDGKTLTVTDSNQHSGTYTYVLNFTGAPSLDPIIDNGGPGVSYPNYTWYAVGAVALLVVILLVLRPMFRNR